MEEHSAGVVLVHGEKFLLLHYESGHWDFVKGKIEPGESNEETVRRETEEETGITDLDFIPGFQESIHYFYMREGQRISKTVVFFLAKTSTENVTLSHEHIGYQWLSYEDALEQLTFDNAKELLKKANALL